MKTYAMTGGATGIGAATKERLRAAGNTVIVVDIKDAEIIADLSTVEGREKAVAGIKAASPDGLDGFIPVAGLGPAARPPSLISSVNYFGAQEMVEALKGHVAKKKGVVVLISSNSAPMARHDEELVNTMLAGDEKKTTDIVNARGDGGPQDAYAGSKLALTRWMRRNTVAYAKEGVRITALAPGLISTPLTDAAKEDPAVGKAMADFAAMLPSGREGKPEEMAEAIDFLLNASFCYGGVLFVDGGSDALLRNDDF